MRHSIQRHCMVLRVCVRVRLCVRALLARVQQSHPHPIPIQHCSAHWAWAWVWLLAGWGWALAWEPVRSPCCREEGVREREILPLRKDRERGMLWADEQSTRIALQLHQGAKVMLCLANADTHTGSSKSREMNNIQCPGYQLLTAAAHQQSWVWYPLSVGFLWVRITNFCLQYLCWWFHWKQPKQEMNKLCEEALENTLKKGNCIWGIHDSLPWRCLCQKSWTQECVNLHCSKLTVQR